MMTRDEFFRALLAAAKEAGADEAEAYFAEDESFRALATKGVIENYAVNTAGGLSLRVLKDGKMGSSFTEALDNDLNTSLAVTALYDVLKEKTTGKTKLALLAEFDSVLGLNLISASNALNAEKEKDVNGISPEDAPIIALINERTEAKKAKNYARADEIRRELSEMGITLIDTAEGTKFERA